MRIQRCIFYAQKYFGLQITGCRGRMASYFQRKVCRLYVTLPAITAYQQLFYVGLCRHVMTTLESCVYVTHRIFFVIKLKTTVTHRIFILGRIYTFWVICSSKIQDTVENKLALVLNCRKFWPMLASIAEDANFRIETQNLNFPTN